MWTVATVEAPCVLRSVATPPTRARRTGTPASDASVGNRSISSNGAAAAAPAAPADMCRGARISSGTRVER